MAIPKAKKKKVRARRVSGISGAPKTPGRVADMYFQHEVEQKQIIDLVKSWIRAEFPKEQATIILKQPDWKFSFPHWACIIHTNDEERKVYLHNRVSQLLTEGATKPKTVKTDLPKQDPVNNWIAELEEVVDLQDSKFDFYQFARLKNINKLQIQKIIDYYKPVQEELLLAKSGKEEQLKEAYSYLKRKGLNDKIDFFNRMLSELERHIVNKKVVRAPRKPKIKSAAQLVKSVKFLKESNELKIVSINPESIIDMKQLWVYNTKYRKLVHYHSLEGGFKFKGTTLMNFDSEASVCKTLRKPEQQLNDLLKSGKVKLRTYMNQLTTKPSNFTGRINADTLLLRVL